MNTLGNFVWLVLGGFVLSMFWALAGILMCATIIGIPFGLQAFKIAAFVLWPFGREPEVGNMGPVGLVGNILWIVLFGWELAVGHLVMGLIFCLTIIGVPIGLQHFKVARLAFIPFGADIITT